MHTNFCGQNNFKKPGACRPVKHAPGLKLLKGSRNQLATATKVRKQGTTLA